MSEDFEDLTDNMIKEVLMAEKKLTLFIRAHLYLEHYLDLAIEQHFPNQMHLLDVPYFSTDLKLRILHGGGFLTDVLYLNGKTMNEIRNRFAHNLNPNQDKIQSKIDKMLIPSHPAKIADTLDRFEKYKIVAIDTITALKNAVENNERTSFYPEITIPESEK